MFFLKLNISYKYNNIKVDIIKMKRFNKTQKVRKYYHRFTYIDNI